MHLQVYDYIPHILRSHPLFGLGYNNFSVFYEHVTGKTNWGPHSFYAQLVIETGLVGTALFAVFLCWVFRRLRAARALGARARPRRQPARPPRAPARVGHDRRARRDDGRERLLPHDAASITSTRSWPSRSRRRSSSGRRGRGEGARADDVVSALGGRRRGRVRRRRGRGAAGRRCRGACRLAGRLPPLRHRLRRRHRPEPAREAVARRGGAAVPRRATRGRRGVRRGTSTSCTPTGSRPRSRRSRPGKPFVLQVWGTDVELARRAPWLVRPLVRRARLVDRGVVVPRRRGARRWARGTCA